MIGLNRNSGQSGFSMIEVLVSMVIVAFGLLGLAAFQLRVQANELESYQRAQALALLGDMAARMKVRRQQAADFVGADFGGGENCSGASGTVAGDRCEWSALLNGAAEQNSSGNLGAMIGARGCITEIQAPNPAAGVCAPGIYEISIAWQGLTRTVAPSNNCGSGSFGDEALRKVVSTRVAFGQLGCV